MSIHVYYGMLFVAPDPSSVFASLGHFYLSHDHFRAAKSLPPEAGVGHGSSTGEVGAACLWQGGH